MKIFCTREHFKQSIDWIQVRFYLLSFRLTSRLINDNTEFNFTYSSRITLCTFEKICKICFWIFEEVYFAFSFWALAIQDAKSLIISMKFPRILELGLSSCPLKAHDWNVSYLIESIDVFICNLFLAIEDGGCLSIILQNQSSSLIFFVNLSV